MAFQIEVLASVSGLKIWIFNPLWLLLASYISAASLHLCLVGHTKQVNRPRRHLSVISFFRVLLVAQPGLNLDRSLKPSIAT